MTTAPFNEFTSGTPTDELASRARVAATAFAAWSAQPPRARARALVAAAAALDAAADELIVIAARETGLTEVRLRGELKRTTVQLRLFADVIADGSYLDVRLDEADPEFALGPRPDLRRTLVPLGPVLNFAASNFPFAFSVAGGDTASALAAGSSVIVKAHWGHPELSQRIGRIVSDALEGAGAPQGTLQVIFGQEQGVAMLRDEHIAASTFTGSIHAGRLLADIAAARPAPIPFYGELGSVNPQFVTRAKLGRDLHSVVEGYVASVSSSAGQFCTKPGFLFVSDASVMIEPVHEAAQRVGEHRMLNPRIAQGYLARRETVLATDGVSVIAPGTVRFDDDANAWVTPTLVSVSVAILESSGRRLLDESFGPLSVVVEYRDESTLADLVRRLFPGNLTGGVHALDDEATPELVALIDQLHRSSGRVLFNGWPTGVAVTSAMQHGGPWPATTNDAGTSVGTAAIGRFLRGVSYQNMPQHLLPESLRDDNPWHVPRRTAPAGESTSWGNLG
ncbi:MAG: aldehyde dehydrogenase (NADP(+)) [Acidimicrobiaceae bacterium]|nr:aldehyde dehydrogenase (NADP(+)) [Acidimicrobiaceae bacterium]